METNQEKQEELPDRATCQHDFELLTTSRSSIYNGFSTTWTRLDIFFCKRCLWQKEYTKTDTCRDTPLWY